MLYLEKIEVECYSGYTLNESPRAFTYRGTRFVIREVFDRWYEGGLTRESPIINYFRVHTEGGREFILRYDSSADEWALCLRYPYITN